MRPGARPPTRRETLYAHCHRSLRQGTQSRAAGAAPGRPQARPLALLPPARGPGRPHGRLETMLERAEGDGGGVLVVVDGVFSMEGDLPNLPEIARLCREHGARLMVDEAHGVGVLGARGTGASEAYGIEDQVDLRMGTFSKSLASCGGFIAGPSDVLDFLRIQSRSFMFT